MAQVIKTEGGLRFITRSIPLAGMISILKSACERDVWQFRYSINNGTSFSQYYDITTENDLSAFLNITQSQELIIDIILDPKNSDGVHRNVISTITPSTVYYDRSIFSIFFKHNDAAPLLWALNVLEKLFEPGIIPLYVKRDTPKDFADYFSTITLLFAYIVVYARKFRFFNTKGEFEENADTLVKNFISGLGIAWDDLSEERFKRAPEKLILHWFDEFKKRGTLQIADKSLQEFNDGAIAYYTGELCRLVGYQTPNEFLFGALSPQNTGWCIGWSSPTWDGTETINALSKGYDFGPDYSGGREDETVSFVYETITLDKQGNQVANQLVTKEQWKILIGENNFPTAMVNNIGVGNPQNYPIVGTVNKVYHNGLMVFSFDGGSGVSGISTQHGFIPPNNSGKSFKDFLIEVYPGLDYEIMVWVKSVEQGVQNIDFGVHCYDKDGNFVNSVRLNDFSISNSFFEEEGYHNPCRTPNTWYRLRGIIYNIAKDKDENNKLSLNFEGGKPLRFDYGFSSGDTNASEVRYLAPYLIQNRSASVTIYVAGMTVKPLTLPVLANKYAEQANISVASTTMTQGWMGQKHFVTLYSCVNSPKTKQQIERITKEQLLGYRNILVPYWLDFVKRDFFFITFIVENVAIKGDKVPGALVGVVGGTYNTEGLTNKNGYFRMQYPPDTDGSVYWYVEYRGARWGMNGLPLIGENVPENPIRIEHDLQISVGIAIPVLIRKVYSTNEVDFQVRPMTYGSSNNILGNGFYPKSNVKLVIQPKEGYRIQHIFVRETQEYLPFNEEDGASVVYMLGTYDITIEVSSELIPKIHFTINSKTLPPSAKFDNELFKVIANKNWKLDELPVSWVTLKPMSGLSSENGITISAEIKEK